MFNELLQRREHLLGELETVAVQCARNPSDIRIIAVTKFFPVEVIHAAYEVGFREIGENRVQDASQKRTVLSDLTLRWHGIGHLQTNKAKLAVETFDELHGLDREDIIDKVADACNTLKKNLAVFVQVNASGKSGQSGCEPEFVKPLLERIHRCSFLEPVGLMCIAAPVDEVGETEVRKQFAALRKMRDQLVETDLLPKSAGLSMGMSGDWKLAVQEGATLLRIGTAIFGERV